MPALVKAFELIGTAQVAKSAMEAQRDFLIINEDDTITFNKERVLFDAKQRALGMVDGYQPPEEETFRLPGATGRAAIDMALSRCGAIVLSLFSTLTEPVRKDLFFELLDERAQNLRSGCADYRSRYRRARRATAASRPAPRARAGS